MRDFFREYGSIILAVAGTMTFLGCLWNPLFSKGGMIVTLLKLWCDSGC